MDNSPNRSGRRRWGVAVAGITLAGLLLLLVSSIQSVRQRGLSVVVDTNGVPRVAGVPLGNTNVRDAVFRMMGSAGLKVNASTSPGFSNVSDAQFGKFAETMSSMSRAGLLPTNVAPNPFE